MDHHYGADDENAMSRRLYKKIVTDSGYTRYDTYSCYHCKNAKCISACLFKAIDHGQNGWVVVDQKGCIGCQACKEACPFDIPQFDKAGKMVKCDGCGGKTYCVKICPNGALSVAE